MRAIRGDNMEKVRRNAPILVSVLLVLMTAVVFARVIGFDFTIYDDDVYVTKNPAVQAGLNRLTLEWAFRTMYNANWHPLTWISYLLDSRLFGIDSHAFHAVNLLLHMANVVLLFLLLRRMTSSLWKSALVAALFAVHPLHVESVAWVAERKDVLSTLFWILTMWAYVRYTERPDTVRQVIVLVLFALGLMAKPMLVTLPLILLLMDYWPLQRLKKVKTADLIWEKLPMFGLSLASSLMTYKAQQAWGSTIPIRFVPPILRVENALVSYASYIGKMVVPRGLAAFYPYPDKLPLWEVVGSAVLLVGVTLLVLKAARRHPYLAFGWLWYLVTLLPVIGLIQVGSQAMADRYTYVPLIGLFIMAAWLPGQWGNGVMGRWGKRTLPTAAVLIIGALMVCSWMQVGYWRDDITLFERAVGVTKDNYMMINNLAVAYDNAGRTEEAVAAYEETIRLCPGLIQPHFNLAAIYYNAGRFAEAWAEVRLCRKYGYEPDAEFIRRLSAGMPDPSK